MNLRKNWKWIMLGYLVVAVVSYFVMNRVEKLESQEEIATYHQTVAINIG